MMNREQRRKYQASIKNMKQKSKCPLCGFETCFSAYPKLKPYEGTKTEFTAEDFDTVVKCEICGGTVLESPALTKLIRPGVRLPMALDIFQMALKYEEEHPEEEKKEEEIQDGEFVEVAQPED